MEETIRETDHEAHSLIATKVVAVGAPARPVRTRRGDPLSWDALLLTNCGSSREEPHGFPRFASRLGNVSVQNHSLKLRPRRRSCRVRGTARGVRDNAPAEIPVAHNRAVYKVNAYIPGLWWT